MEVFSIGVNCPGAFLSLNAVILKVKFSRRGPVSRKVPPEKWLHYNQLRKMDFSLKDAAFEAGISERACYDYERGKKSSTGYVMKQMLDDLDVPGPKHPEELSKIATQCLDDFGMFRWHFLGHVTLPWHEEAAHYIVRAVESDEREYVCMNTPPEAGKTTLVMHDLFAWLIVRNRRIRILSGSAYERLAKINVKRLRRTFERRNLITAQDYDLRHGMAVDSTHNLIEEYGRFKPLTPDMWTDAGFIVAQFDDELIDQKEPTVSAFGMDSGSLGWRVDVAGWDDLSDKKTIATIESAQKQFDWFDKEAEKRVNMNGAFILLGQRLGPRDIYKHALDKVSGVADDPSLDDWDDDKEVHGIDPDTYQIVDAELAAPPKYKHIVFKAHYEDLCQGRVSHRRDAAPYGEGGCLLDPKRLNWTYLSAEQKQDRKVFETVYQQHDTDDQDTLINHLILIGGTDPILGEDYPGNYNNQRALLQPPKLQGRWYSVVTTDPSPANFWAIQWWLWHPASNMRFLMDIHRRRMSASSFLDRDGQTSEFKGVMEDMWQMSVRLNFPIGYWIYEVAAAQRFFNQMNAVKDWLKYREVRLVPHETNINKIDPKYGVTMLTNKYKAGLYDLPNAPVPGTRKQVAYLTNELTTWPDSTTDDHAMANWFFETFIMKHEKRERRSNEDELRQRRPSWVADPNAIPTNVHNFPQSESGLHVPSHVKPSALRSRGNRAGYSRIPQIRVGR